MPTSLRNDSWLERTDSTSTATVSVVVSLCVCESWRGGERARASVCVRVRARAVQSPSLYEFSGMPGCTMLGTRVSWAGTTARPALSQKQQQGASNTYGMHT